MLEANEYPTHGGDIKVGFVYFHISQLSNRSLSLSLSLSFSLSISLTLFLSPSQSPSSPFLSFSLSLPLFLSLLLIFCVDRFLKHPYKRFCFFIFFIFTTRDLSLSLSKYLNHQLIERCADGVAFGRISYRCTACDSSYFKLGRRLSEYASSFRILYCRHCIGFQLSCIFLFITLINIFNTLYHPLLPLLAFLTCFITVLLNKL